MSTSTAAAPPVRRDPQIDPRGQQFAAALTAVVLAVVLLLAPSPIAIGLLAIQAVLFAVGPGSASSTPLTHGCSGPWSGPGSAPPAELEDAAPPRFAQAVGLAFALVGLVGFLAGATLLGLVATGFALVAALLNAVFGFCLGCEMYLLIRRFAG